MKRLGLICRLEGKNPPTINESQIKINVNKYEYDDIVIIVSIKPILTKNNLS